MSGTILSFTLLPLQAAGDTVVTVAARTPLETATAWALVVLALLGILLVGVAIALFFEVRKGVARAGEVMENIETRVEPVAERVRGIATNVEYVSASIRKEVERVTELVASSTERLREATERIEARIDEFNALVDIVQAEAEETILSTAAAARGMREGARALVRGEGGKAGGRRDRAGSRRESEEEEPGEGSSRDRSTDGGVETEFDLDWVSRQPGKEGP